MSGMERKPSTPDDFNDPDRQNSEQDETGTQAQDIAEEVLNGDDEPIEDSEKGSPSSPADVVPRDVPDLVDKLKEMETTGRIDMGAFEGEEDMDDDPSE